MRFSRAIRFFFKQWNISIRRYYSLCSVENYIVQSNLFVTSIFALYLNDLHKTWAFFKLFIHFLLKNRPDVLEPNQNGNETFLSQATKRKINLYEKSSPEHKNKFACTSTIGVIFTVNSWIVNQVAKIFILDAPERRHSSLFMYRCEK